MKPFGGVSSACWTLMSCNSHPFGGGEIAVRGGVAPRSPPVPSGPASGPSGSLHTSGAWCAYVWLGVSARSPARPSLRPRVPQPGPVGEVTRWSETIVAFACLCLCGIETAVAFAGAKWAFLAQFSGAEVMPVSAVPYWGRAVVMVVSMSPRCCASCAKKFALRTKYGPKLACCGVLGEFFRGDAAGGVVVGELCRPLGLTGLRVSRCLPDPR